MLRTRKPLKTLDLMADTIHDGARSADFCHIGGSSGVFLSLLLTVSTLAPDCGSSPVPAGQVPVLGAEQLSWDQSAPDVFELARYTYVAYVDGARRLLADATCQPTTADTQAECLARLPAMAPGAHRLELATVFNGFGFEFESPRSAPLDLLVVGGATNGFSRAQARLRTDTTRGVETDAPSTRTARDGTRFAIDTLSTTLDMPSALAVAPDRRVFIAEASGIVRTWQDGRLVPEPAEQLADVAKSGDVGLVGMALHPRFPVNHQLYLAYTARRADGTFANRVVRFREVGGIFGEAAVLLEDRVPEPPQRTPRLRFGTDQQLYVAFATGRDPSAARDLASYAGKILRLNEDGTTPADNAGYSPIFSDEHRFPGAFDWHPALGQLWLSERDWDDNDALRIVVSSRSRTAYRFDPIVDASAAAFYTNTAIPGFKNDLFIAALDGRHIRRVRFDPTAPDRVSSTERLLDGEFGRISDIVAGPDGAIYFCTSNPPTSTRSADDRLVRLASPIDESRRDLR